MQSNSAEKYGAFTGFSGDRLREQTDGGQTAGPDNFFEKFFNYKTAGRR